MKKNIAFLVGNLAFGGGERMLWMLMRELTRRGYDISIYSYNEDWQTQTEFNDVHILKVLPTAKNKLISYFELKKTLAEYRPDCIISFSLSLIETAVWAARANGIPIICSERCDPAEVPDPGKRDIHRLLRRLSFRYASGVVFQTEDVQKYFSKAIQKHSVVIPNPVIDNDLPCYGESDIEKKIVSSGRLSPEKNFEMLIRAFAALGNNEYTLTIYGDGPLRTNLEKLIDDLGISSRVFLPGRVERVVDYIAKGDIFVMPSNHEGMPNSLIEGMAMGLAPVSTDFASGGARALIKNGVNGFLVPVGDTDALTNVLKDLIDNPNKKKNIKAEAIKIRETHSKDLILAKWVDYIEKLIQSYEKK